ncbi:DoxX family protein [Loktanella sp. SALINAS62]|uniref:DoxX family protein n=1 Tax=Loktanella sp. SALINAS62 TaxID=2706124 RepID=UPI001B8AFD3C|nr:DoxX family protein [Loktanella sp. SALINAS62]MBS1301114.1 DoxX family membrane protein [Loktanella sp. SALINAS62]
MTLLILILRIALTVAFLYYGLRKLVGGTADVAVYDALGFGQWPRPITGSVEVICAIGLWVVGFQGIAALGLLVTVLTGTAALSLFTTLPRAHMFALIAGAAVLVWYDMADILLFLPQT